MPALRLDTLSRTFENCPSFFW